MRSRNSTRSFLYVTNCREGSAITVAQLAGWKCNLKITWQARKSVNLVRCGGGGEKSRRLSHAIFIVLFFETFFISFVLSFHSIKKSLDRDTVATCHYGAKIDLIILTGLTLLFSLTFLRRSKGAFVYNGRLSRLNFSYQSSFRDAEFVLMSLSNFIFVSVFLSFHNNSF